MIINFTLQELNQPAIKAIIAASIGFPCAWFLSYSTTIKNYFFRHYPETQAWINYIVFQKLMGFLFFGVLPGAVVLCSTPYSLSMLGFNLHHIRHSLLYIAMAGIPIIIVNYFAAQKKANLDMYPQMRIKQWTLKKFITSCFFWTVYMIGYEFMYRGFLLIICYHAFGFATALAINLMFYSATHIAKGVRETIGAFPYGIALCFATISTGSLLFAISTHLILALFNDFYSIYHNPEMNFTFLKNKHN